MTPILELKTNNHNFVNFSGFASLSGYDPAMHRFFEALKQAICDGVPVLVRLHSTSEYPFNKESIHLIDMENHAVCIVGYDDESQTVAIMDPMKPEAIQWTRVDHIKADVVDSSKGIATFLSPLWIDAINENAKLGIKVGFYVPKMNVMDKDNMLITDVNLVIKSLDNVVLTSSFSESTIDALTPHTFNFNLPQNFDSIVIEASAKVRGSRPYKFQDNISSARMFNFGTATAQCIEKETVKKRLLLEKVG